MQPKDSATNEQLVHNVKGNMEALRALQGCKFLKRVRAHEGRAFIVASGPSLKDFIAKFPMLNFKRRHDAIFCIKHALPQLAAAKIVPDFCVILDPRDIEGESTHGIKRKDLFKDISPETAFLVGSMTHPSVSKELLARGAHVVGWHAATDALMGNLKDLVGNDMVIMGGSCAATRAISIAQVMGFRDVHVYGVDASHEGIPTSEELKRIDGHNRPWWNEVRFLDGPYRWTSGEMVALAQDVHALSMMQSQGMGDIRITFNSKGLAGDIWAKLPSWSEAWQELLDKETPKA